MEILGVVIIIGLYILFRGGGGSNESDFQKELRRRGDGD